MEIFRNKHMKPFAIHPAPWTIKNNYYTGSNGESVAVIVDADGEVVTSDSNWFAFNTLWEFYQQLTPEQIVALGQDEPQEARYFKDQPPPPGGWFVFVNPEHFIVNDGDLYRVSEKYPNCVEQPNNKENFFHMDDFGPETQWRPPTSREVYKNTGRTE